MYPMFQALHHYIKNIIYSLIANVDIALIYTPNNTCIYTCIFTCKYIFIVIFIFPSLLVYRGHILAYGVCGGGGFDLSCHFNGSVKCIQCFKLHTIILRILYIL